MTPPRPIDFQLYLESLTTNDKYRRRWCLYTPTDAIRACQPAHEEPGLDLELMVALLQPQQPTDDCSPKSKADQEEPRTLPVLQGIHQYLAEANHLLLVGRPGLGKSTVLLRLLVEQAQAALRDPAAKIPVLLELRYLDAHQPVVLDRIEAFLQNHNLNVEGAALKAALAEGRFLLLIDGVNELPSESARRAVDRFRRDYSQSQMVFTIRDVALGGDLGITNKLEMQLLSEAQIQQFIRAYLPAQERSMLQQLQGRARELGKTPLFLEMFCQVFAKFKQIPANLGLLFQCFVGGYEKLKQNVPTSEGFRYWKADLLRHLAFMMLKAGKPTDLQVSISRLEAEAILTEFLQGKVDYPAQRAKEWLEDLLEHHLIQLANPYQLEFHHQLIQEYYAAEYLLLCLPQLKDEVLKRDYLNYLKWTEPVALMLALVEEEAQALRVVWLAMDEVDLMLGARLAGEVKPAFQATTVGWIDQKELPIEIKIRCWRASRSEYAIPSLLQCIYSKTLFISHGAAYSLGCLGIQSAIPKLLKTLESQDCDAREAAVLALQRLEDRNIVPDLIQIVRENQNFFARKSAAEVLGDLGDEFIIPDLIQALKDSEPGVRASIIEALGKLGDEAIIPTLLQCLQDSEPVVRTSAIEALGKLGDKAIIPTLLQCLQDSESAVRASVIEALGELGDRAIIPTLLQCLQDQDSVPRRRAARALKVLSSETAIRKTDNKCIIDILLQSLLTDSDSVVCHDIAIVIGSWGDTDTVPVLINFLQYTEYHVRNCAEISLELLSRKININFFLKFLNHSNSYVRKSTAKILGKTQDKTIVAALIQALEDPNSYVRISIAESLACLGREEAIPVLDWYLEYPDRDLNWRAAKALKNLGNDIAVLILLQTLDTSDDPWIQVITAISLAELGIDVDISDLLQHLKDEDFELRMMLIDLLGILGNESTIPDLLHIIQDQDEHEYIVGSAGKAITKMASPKPLPVLRQQYLNLPRANDGTTIDVANVGWIIDKIQNRCQFYNYGIWQVTESNLLHLQGNKIIEQSQITSKYNIHGSPPIVEGDLKVQGDQVNTKVVLNITLPNSCIES